MPDKRKPCGRDQYHGTTPEAARSIMEEGARAPAAKGEVRTHNFQRSAVFTAGDPQYAALYGRNIVKMRIKRGARIMRRTMRASMRKGENLETAVARWITEADAKKYDMICVPDQQSGIGNVVLNPGILEPVEIIKWKK